MNRISNVVKDINSYPEDKINYLKSETTLIQTLNIENYYSKMILINPSGLINVFQKP